VTSEDNKSSEVPKTESKLWLDRGRRLLLVVPDLVENNVVGWLAENRDLVAAGVFYSLIIDGTAFVLSQIPALDLLKYVPYYLSLGLGLEIARRGNSISRARSRSFRKHADIAKRIHALPLSAADKEKYARRIAEELIENEMRSAAVNTPSQESTPSHKPVRHE
jgi:hypothetical protein